MTIEKRLTVGQVKAMLANLDAEFPPLTSEQIEANKVSEKRRAADRKKAGKRGNAACRSGNLESAWNVDPTDSRCAAR